MVLKRVLHGRAMLSGQEVTVPVPPGLVLQKSLLLFTVKVAFNQPQCASVQGQLLPVMGGTSLWFKRDSDCGDAVVVAWQVVEFEAGVTVQRGRLLTLSLPTVDLPVSAQPGPNTFPVVTASSAGATMDETDFFSVVPSTAGWRVRHQGGTPLSLSWQLADFGNTSTVLHAPFALSGLSAQVPLPPGTVDQRMVTLDYAFTTAVDMPASAGLVTAQRQPAGVFLERYETTTAPLEGYVHAVEWPDGVRVETATFTQRAMDLVTDVSFGPMPPPPRERRVCVAGLLQRAGRVASPALPLAVKQGWFLVECTDGGLRVERDEGGSEATVVVWHLVF